MSIEKSYTGIAPFFESWVKIFEYHLRKRELEDSHLGNKRILIISPPTDPGIILFAKSNTKGETIFLSPTQRIKNIVYEYLKKKKIENLITVVSPVDRLQFDSDYFDVVFANCYFDFCQKEEILRSLKVINFVLKKGGLLLAVYMDNPHKLLSELWARIFRYAPAISQGCHPVGMDQFLTEKYTIIKNIGESRFGFPLRYIAARKQ
ncbi:MAG: methyltransferase domain-containing protein [Calditrichaeota bacterium]|nr:methyltransferase domain-containing protein [Calditrichota bacterium]